MNNIKKLYLKNQETSKASHSTKEEVDASITLTFNRMRFTETDRIINKIPAKQNKSKQSKKIK